MRSQSHLDALMPYMLAAASLGFMWWYTSTNEALAFIALLLIALLAGHVGSSAIATVRSFRQMNDSVAELRRIQQEQSERIRRLEDQLAAHNPPPTG
jgi:hypothetical protein